MALRLSSDDIRRLAKSLRNTSFYDFPADFGAEETGITYYLKDQASDIPTYSKLLRDPPSGAEDIDSVVVNAGAGEVLIEAYATVAGDPDALSIGSGTWVFNTYSYVDNGTVGTTQIVIRVYQRTGGGVETELFNVTSPRITNTTVQLNTFLATEQQFPLTPTDRIVIKFYAKTTSVPNRTVSLVHDGTAHYTHLHTPVVE